MKHSQKAGLVGGLISLSFFVYNIYVAFRISKGFTFDKSLYYELINAIFIQLFLLSPAIILTFFKHFKKDSAWIFWLYPVVIGFGLLNTLLSKDPISAGLPMVVLVFPFCFIYTIVLLILKKKS